MFRFKVRIPVRSLTYDLVGFLDMLRYDSATVLDWSRSDDAWSVWLRSDRSPTVDRWSSFSLRVTDIEQIPTYSRR